MTTMTEAKPAKPRCLECGDVLPDGWTSRYCNSRCWALANEPELLIRARPVRRFDFDEEPIEENREDE